ncbi:MAG: glycine--tRNA ligase [Candidatus Levybacteria bacterium RIFCSPHIGHO2_01_FULL_37_17]|nr:MAG: glycine--tRNA ligase [Candidatus Levybacteria bacterium RIFCSPHIGHO2_01_FULL_37_17]OGH36664.1 MAG: glycine--tRNA ligase [Candidatus Levybacteria bacterium RIFCSPLOWO2_01_FULL_38_23]
MDEKMQQIVALCKRRGFIFPGSEIYGGLTGTWDCGPLGVELKNNIKKQWWLSMVQSREDVVGIDASIVMNKTVWEKSGHLKAFTDPLVECKICHSRFRADKKEEIENHEKTHKDKVSWTEPKNFNLLVKALFGVLEGEQSEVYLRGEITQGAFVNFENVVSSTRVKIPFGIAQIGKAFRNEITPGNFTYRSREFEQMELEFFVENNDKEADKWFDYWKEQRMSWYAGLGINKDNLRFRKHEDSERAHYAKYAEDIEYNAPFGWSEFEGIHHRGDYDLKAHALNYVGENGEKYTPWVIETSGGVDRSMLFFLLDSFSKEGERTVLKLHPKLAPYKVAVFPLLANKEDLVKRARSIFENLKPQFMTAWDDRGNIGKRYLAQDEAGTPWCVTVDFQTLEDETVTVRDRDTAKQKRIKVEELSQYFQNKLT